MSKTNHIEDFRYKMRQECIKQNKPCKFCKYYYVVETFCDRFKGCFLNDLQNYISYQESKHG